MTTEVELGFRSQVNKQPKPLRHWLEIAGIFLIALFLRLYSLMHMEFKDEEQRILRLSFEVLEGGWLTDFSLLPQTGLESSSGTLANPPFFTWVIAIFWKLTGSPLGVTRMIATVNSLAIIPFYYWASKTFDKRKALYISLWIAVSPFAVFYSRKIWQPELLFPASVLLLWAIHWGYQGKFWRALSTSGFVLLFYGHLHMSGPIFLAGIGLTIFLEKIKAAPIAFKPKRPSPASIIVFLFGFAALFFFTYPYLRYLANHGLVSFAADQVKKGFNFNIITNLSRVLASNTMDFHFGYDWGDFEKGIQNYLRWATLLTGAPLAVLGVWSWIRNPRKLPVLGLASMIYVGFFLIFKFPSFPHYILMLSPLPALIVCGGFDIENFKFESALNVLRGTHLCMAAVLTLTCLQWLSGQGGAAGDYGLSYKIQNDQALALAMTYRSDQKDESWRVVGDLKFFRCERPSSVVEFLVEFHTLENSKLPGTVKMPNHQLSHWLDGIQICSRRVLEPEGNKWRWFLQEKQDQ